MSTSIIRKIKRIKEEESIKILLTNFASLSFLQFVNYILPLITFPYLVRVLGVDKFGLLAFASATVAYLQILTDYGFSLSATKEVSIHRDNKKKLQEIFSSVMIIKTGLLIVGLILLSCLIFTFSRFKENWIIYYLTYTMLMGQALFPVWFFQGIEKMKYIIFINLFARGIFTILIFSLVKGGIDYIYVPLLNSMSFLLAGILSLWIVYRNFGITVKPIELKRTVLRLKEGWHIFASTLSISIYTISTPFTLGLFTNNTIVGYYSAAEKIIQAFKGLMTPLTQTFYPFLSKKVLESAERGVVIIRGLVKYVALFTAFISLMVFLFARQLVFLILGREYMLSVLVLKILAIHPFLVGLSNILGIQTLLTFNKHKAFQIILTSAALLNLILSIILVPIYYHLGFAVSVTITEIFVAVTMLFYLQKSGIKVILEKKNA